MQPYVLKHHRDFSYPQPIFIALSFTPKTIITATTTIYTFFIVIILILLLLIINKYIYTLLLLMLYTSLLCFLWRLVPDSQNKGRKAEWRQGGTKARFYSVACYLQRKRIKTSKSDKLFIHNA